MNRVWLQFESCDCRSLVLKNGIVGMILITIPKMQLSIRSRLSAEGLVRHLIRDRESVKKNRNKLPKS